MCMSIMSVQVGTGELKQVHKKCPTHPQYKLREPEGCPVCGLDGIKSLGREYTILKRRRRKQQPTRAVG